MSGGAQEQIAFWVTRPFMDMLIKAQKAAGHRSLAQWMREALEGAAVAELDKSGALTTIAVKKPDELKKLRPDGGMTDADKVRDLARRGFAPHAIAAVSAMPYAKVNRILNGAAS